MSKSKSSESIRTDASPSPQAAITVRIDESRMQTTYANFFRVAGAVDEVVADFGFHPAIGNSVPNAIAISQRIVLGYPASKRLLHALHAAIATHERSFGANDDVSRRPQTKAA